MGKHRREPWAVREQIARELLDVAETIDYQTIKAVAKASHIPAPELIVQAEGNDPFYAGSPVPRQMAEWFAENYRQYNWGQTHIRRCHYQLASLSVPLPDGSIYENTEKCAYLLYVTAKTARYLKLIPVSALEDHRNDEALNYRPSLLQQELEVHSDLDLYGEFQFPFMPDLPRYAFKEEYDFYTVRSLQPYHLEIWCEKTTMNDILLPLCQRYGLTLQTFAGEASLYAVHQLVQRIERYQKPTRILYISDFDPSGNNMPVAMANKLAWLVRDQRVDADIRVFPIVLTHEQVEHYQLPRIPIKESARNKQTFEGKYGDDAVELDALEALHPGELQKIVLQTIRSYHDKDLWKEVDYQQGEIRMEFEEIREEVYADHQQEIAALQADYEQKKVEFEAWVEDFNRRTFALYTYTREKLEERMPDLGGFPLPEGKKAKELGDGLYNSARGYYDQVKAFKIHQGKYHSDECDEQIEFGS